MMRTVSVMNVNGVTPILTFDKDDFKRYSNITALSSLDV
jgi:predicted nucleic acid-binding protein